MKIKEILNNDTFKLFCLIAVIVIIVLMASWATSAQWNECRNMGFSELYCFKHIQ